MRGLLTSHLYSNYSFIYSSIHEFEHAFRHWFRNARFLEHMQLKDRKYIDRTLLVFRSWRFHILWFTEWKRKIHSETDWCIYVFNLKKHLIMHTTCICSELSFPILPGIRWTWTYRICAVHCWSEQSIPRHSLFSHRAKKKNNNLKGLEAPEVVEIFDFSFQLGLVISWSFFRPFSLFFPLLRTTRSKLKTAGSSQESNSFSTASEIVPFFHSLLLY